MGARIATTTFIAVMVLLGVFGTQAREEKTSTRVWNFEADQMGEWPSGFSFGRTGKGRLGRWTIRAEDDAPSGTNVLAQVDADDTDFRFPVAVADDISLTDLRLSVQCKPVSGRVDQACGLVFRYQDENNYYVTRANPLEGNVRLYRVVDGSRRRFASWDGPVAGGKWNELRVEARGDHLEIFWNAQKVIDSHDQTFPGAGRVGVWTKADSVTSFDDLRVEPLGSCLTLDIQTIEGVLGLSGTMTDGVFKVTKARDDIRVTLDGFSITPRMGLTAWMAFRPQGNKVILMGDIPLLEDELQPVLSALMKGGVEVTALHNHFVGEEPRVMFLHVGGKGEPLSLARGLRAGLDTIERVRSGGPSRTPASEVHSDLDIARLSTILGTQGALKAGIFKVTIPRPRVPLAEMGFEVNSRMGFNSWAAFQGTKDRAAVSGDFAMLPDEVTPIVRELRRHGIEVVALHNHMLREEPRILFLHFWSIGDAEDLARGLRAALDQMASSGH